ncbi:PD-(D/E)XK motif protein [Pseudomonas viridiflava]|uniref:PD-(D/E)XK motif protein n=1 Tax=Pseudomonas viridiflava TaxID=33069 RepID=UPI000F020463
MRSDGRWSLFLTLEDVSLIDIFALLCSDLIELSRDISEVSVALVFVLNRLTSWRLLFERGGLGLLTEAEIEVSVASCCICRGWSRYTAAHLHLIAGWDLT